MIKYDFSFMEMSINLCSTNVIIYTLTTLLILHCDNPTKRYCYLRSVLLLQILGRIPHPFIFQIYNGTVLSIKCLTLKLPGYGFASYSFHLPVAHEFRVLSYSNHRLCCILLAWHLRWLLQVLMVYSKITKHMQLLYDNL